MDKISPVKKVLAYITRWNGSQREILIHTHRDFPEAGLQVPGGTVIDGEGEEEAVVREIREESGLVNVRLVRLLRRYIYYAGYAEQYHDRCIFHLELEGISEEEWDWIIQSDDADSGLVFQYRWYPLELLPELAGDQGDFIHLLL